MGSPEPDRSLYRSFLAVMQQGSLSGAARALGLTQPTIVRHIEALEQSIGLELFIRSQQGLSPTEGALELKPYAESLPATTAAMMRAASGQGKAVKGTVRVSARDRRSGSPAPCRLRRSCGRLDLTRRLTKSAGSD